MVKLGKHVSSEVADAHLADGQTSQRQRHRRRPSNRCVVVFRRRQVPAVPRVPSQRTGQAVRAQRVAHQTQVLETAVPRVPSQRTGQVVRAQRVAHQTQVLETPVLLFLHRFALRSNFQS